MTTHAKTDDAGRAYCGRKTKDTAPRRGSSEESSVSALERVVGIPAADPTRPPRWTSEAFLVPEPWVQDALCAQTDPEEFFPGKGDSTLAAKRVCAACPVTSECLEYALRNDERYGIWAGVSERARRSMKKRRAA